MEGKGQLLTRMKVDLIGISGKEMFDFEAQFAEVVIYCFTASVKTRQRRKSSGINKNNKVKPFEVLQRIGKKWFLRTPAPPFFLDFCTFVSYS